VQGANFYQFGAVRKGKLAIGFAFFLGAIFTMAGVSGLEEGKEEHEVRVKGVTVDPISQNPVVILEEVRQSKAFPIWIGGPEALSIASELEQVPFPRPNSHDLMKSIVEQLQGKLQRVVITEVKNNTYYALLMIRLKGSIVSIDSRPSDAIALALRVKAPIFVTQKVLNEAKAIDLPNKKAEIGEQAGSGIVVQELTPELARHFRVDRPYGLLVSDVTVGSRGERGGLRRGDVIVEVNGKTPHNPRDLETALTGTARGAVLQVLRDGVGRIITLPGRP
jgi:bifunctional DNase/RNase